MDISFIIGSQAHHHVIRNNRTLVKSKQIANWTDPYSPIRLNYFYVWYWITATDLNERNKKKMKINCDSTTNCLIANYFRNPIFHATAILKEYFFFTTIIVTFSFDCRFSRQKHKYPFNIDIVWRHWRVMFSNFGLFANTAIADIGEIGNICVCNGNICLLISFNAWVIEFFKSLILQIRIWRSNPCYWESFYFHKMHHSLTLWNNQ